MTRNVTHLKKTCLTQSSTVKIRLEHPLAWLVNGNSQLINGYESKPSYPTYPKNSGTAGWLFQSYGNDRFWPIPMRISNNISFFRNSFLFYNFPNVETVFPKYISTVSNHRHRNCSNHPKIHQNPLPRYLASAFDLVSQEILEVPTNALRRVFPSRPPMNLHQTDMWICFGNKMKLDKHGCRMVFFSKQTTLFSYKFIDLSWHIWSKDSTVLLWNFVSYYSQSTCIIYLVVVSQCLNNHRQWWSHCYFRKHGGETTIQILVGNIPILDS